MAGTRQTAGDLLPLIDALERAEAGMRADRKALAAGRARIAALLRRIDKIIAPSTAHVSAHVSACVGACMGTRVSTHADERMVIPANIPINIRQSLQAIQVTSFGHVQPDGHLYYVDDADCFALRVAGTLFHGHIGTCGAGALRTDECRYGPRCDRRDTCTFYHDPVTCGGTDRRDWKAYMYASQNTIADTRKMRLFAMHLLLSSLAQ